MKAVLALLMLVVFVAAEPPGPPTIQEACDSIENHRGMRNCDELPEKYCHEAVEKGFVKGSASCGQERLIGEEFRYTVACCCCEKPASV
ncbi:unnamed protein product [Cyprideis torosa]|uniref:Uncharacterized protein n=1 Tax=Cyprideis torosa TaxID=163714 RepID=A0A7R8ZNH9_9CRUS|nr:unnamed protein product [Cyprideis torosa]CAG0898048.1 unnamed protein product [Cyprideis torosa]